MGPHLAGVVVHVGKELQPQFLGVDGVGLLPVGGQPVQQGRKVGPLLPDAQGKDGVPPGGDGVEGAGVDAAVGASILTYSRSLTTRPAGIPAPSSG